MKKSGANKKPKITRVKAPSGHRPKFEKRKTPLFHKPEGILRVGFVGPSNSGKSKLINLILSQSVATIEEFVPVTDRALLSPITILAHSDSNHPPGTVVLSLGGGNTIKFDGTISHLNDLILNQSPIFPAEKGRKIPLEKIQYLTIYSDQSFLQGIEIVDTPGLDRLAEIHSDRFRALLDGMDHIFAVFSLREAQREAWQEIFAPYISKGRVTPVFSHVENEPADERPLRFRVEDRSKSIVAALRKIRNQRHFKLPSPVMVSAASKQDGTLFPCSDAPITESISHIKASITNIDAQSSALEGERHDVTTSVAKRLSQQTQVKDHSKRQARNLKRIPLRRPK